ncbi:MAG: hypothetical protein IJ298_06540 [Ruminococcus sp.]|nr:hypothetical protein [Ruminococcus sp.]
MKKKFIGIIGLLIMLFAFSGCSRIGDKTASLTVVYIVTSVLALIMLAGYCFMIRKKDPWFLLLFSAVFVVNIGYLTLAISATLEEALLANRIAYLGSVFLPLSMFMIIINTCKIRYKKWLPALLLTISTFVFLVAASPGYLDIYYKSVTLTTINGVTVLDKVYGPWHSLYLYYLLIYFSAMIIAIIQAVISKKIESSIHAVILAIAVFVNIGVWLLEQLVKIDFEILSVSYIVSELFLLGLYLLLQENGVLSSLTIKPDLKNTNDTNSESETEDIPESTISSDETQSKTNIQSVNTEEQFRIKCEYFSSKLCTLTPTEREIYLLYLKGKSTKEIMAELGIKENTLKYHNKNIYSKLGVSSRKELLKIATVINTTAKV